MGPGSESRWRNHIHEGISHLVVYQLDQTLFMGFRSRSRDCFLNIEIWWQATSKSGVCLNRPQTITGQRDRPYRFPAYWE